MSRLLDITGKRFGRLTVLNREGSNLEGRAMWKCKCDCGSEKIILGKSLRVGLTKSCGCIVNELRNERTRNKYKGTKLHNSWRAMKGRCMDKNNERYSNYGGRGIVVCDEWRNSFENFRKWALENGYSYGLTIDRIDNDGNYEPNNCRWATSEEQANNKRDNHLIKCKGETKTLIQWADSLNINYSTLFSRLSSGWSIEKAFTTPASRSTQSGCLDSSGGRK